MSVDEYFQLDAPVVQNKKHALVSYCTCLMVFGILVCLMIVIVSMADDATTLLKEGSETIHDIQEVIPDVRRILGIMRTLCENKQFTQHYNIHCG